MRGIAGPARREVPPPRPPARGRHHAAGGANRPSSRVVSGQILGVGLICFGAWTLLDARQLLNSAVGSPLGVRRSVAMSILRPIARVTEAFGLDRLVNGGNRALGRGTLTPGANPNPSVRLAAAPARQHLEVRSRRATAEDRHGARGQAGCSHRARRTALSAARRAERCRIR